MRTKTILPLLLMLALFSCKKDVPVQEPIPVVPPFPMHSQARLMDVFGHPVPDSMPCLKKMTDPDDSTVAYLFKYNTAGLLTKVMSVFNGANVDSILFNYDSQNRLTETIEYESFSITYGPDNKIASLTTSSTSTTYVFSYPATNKVSVRTIEAGGEIYQDTLQFDANHNQTKFTSWYLYPGTAPYLLTSDTYSYSSNIKSAFYPSALNDYFVLAGIVNHGSPIELIGRNVLTNLVSYDDQSQPASQIVLSDSRLNGSFPTFLKYRYTNGSYHEDYSYGFEYDCH